MSNLTTAREEILARIRASLPAPVVNIAASHAAIERRYNRSGALDRKACLEQFIDRLLDYDTEILQVESEAGIAAAIAEALSRKGEESVLAAEAFPSDWFPSDIRVVRDAQLSTAQLDAETAVVTTCEAAISSTGTIILVHEGAQGRRALTLLPDHHICLVKRNQVVESVSEALQVVSQHQTRPLTTISGPSATSDIEMTRIRGVHGPRQLSVILYGKL